ncbi:unnamed protein product, partial [Larinioides sclopetarius]
MNSYLREKLILTHLWITIREKYFHALHFRLNFTAIIMKTFLLFSVSLLLITDICSAAVESYTTEPQAPKAGDCSK